MFLLPTLYMDDSGHEDLFVRVGKETKDHGSGAECWRFQKVEKVWPGIYRGIGTPYFDLKDCYTKL